MSRVHQTNQPRQRLPFRQKTKQWRKENVDMICVVLHERVQFYNRHGAEANGTVLEEIRKALRGEQLAPPTPNARIDG